MKRTCAESKDVKNEKKKKKKKKRLVEQRMSGILRKGDLEGLVESFYIEDITPDIVCKLHVNKGF